MVLTTCASLLANLVNSGCPLSHDTPSLCCHTLQTPLSEVASLLSLVSVTAVHCNVEVLQNAVMGKSVGSIDSV